MPKTSNLAAYFSFMVVLLIGNAPAYSADYGVNGDGSASSNPDLLRGSYETGCYYPAICGGLLVSPNNEEASSQSSNSSLKTSNSKNINNIPPNIASRSALAPIPLIPASPYSVTPNYREDIFTPATTFDWSVALTGAFQKDFDGQRFEVILSPSASVFHKERNAQYDFGVSADIVKASDSEYRIRTTNANFATRLMLDKESLLSLNAILNIGQENVNSSNLASNITTAPFVLGASVNAAYLRQFGSLSGELRLGYNRSIYSNTGLTGGIWQNNSARNNNSFSAGLRLTQEITPIISAYVDLTGERNIYDAAPINFPNTQNNWAYGIRTGVSGNWSDILLADISAGYELRKYDSATLSDSPAITIDSNIAYNMGQGIELSTNLATDVTTPDPTSGASLRVGYSLSAAAKYQINDWLSARASAGGNWASFVGINDIERSYSAGVGLDYTLNKNTKISGDYVYSLFAPTPVNIRDSHRVELGITYSR